MSIFRRRRRKLFFEELFLYGRSFKFLGVESVFLLVRFFQNPYRTCRKFNQKAGEKELYTYGETPLITYEKIVKEAEVGPQDTWIELGSGRGRGCFWLNLFVGCRVIGVERVNGFVFLSKMIQRLFHLKKISFERKDISEIDLRGASILYFYGLKPPKNIPRGVKIISISEPIAIYPVVKSFWVRYPWGRTRAFLQIG